MSTVRWDSDMTGAVRQAADAFMQLQWRRLASNQGRSDLTVPSEWSEFIFDSLRKINDDLEYVPPMWRLCSTVLRCIEVGIQAPATELYLSWHSLANGSQDFYRGVEADISDGANYLDWSHVSRTVLDLVLLGDLSRAGVLAVHAATLARSMEPFTHEQEAVLADIFNLFVDPFTTQAAFQLWRERASQIMFDARHVLDGETDDNPTNIVKQLAFDMLTLATGSTDFLMDLLDRLQLNAFWYVGGIAAVIDPFAPLPRLAAAFRECNTQSDWLFKVGQAALDVTALHDLVGVASIVMELETDSPHTELAKLLLAVHLADIAAPPFVDVGVRGEIVSKRNRIAVQYVRHLRSRCPVLWRLGALYLTYSPMADPQELADHLTHAAAQQHAGRHNVAAVRSYIREFCDPSAPQQQTLRRALQVRLGTNTTAIATLQGVLANLDFVIRQALSVITDAEAKARLQGGELSTAVATWLDGGLHAPAAAAVMERLRSWSKVLHPDKPTLWDRQILDVGIALRSQQIVVHPSVPQDMVQLRSSLRLCELLVDVVPCSTVDGRAASSSGALEAACQSASMASRVAADLELPLAAFFLAATAANCCAPDERQTVLRDLHAAVATAAMRCPPHRREPGHALGHERVVRLLYGLAAATD